MADAEDGAAAPADAKDEAPEAAAGDAEGGAAEPVEAPLEAVAAGGGEGAEEAVPGAGGGRRTGQTAHLTL